MSTATGTPTPRSGALRLSSSSLVQFLHSLLNREHRRPASGRVVVLLRAEPHWDGPRVLTAEGMTGSRTVAVRCAPSPLAAYELTLGHLDSESPAEGELLVVLTDREEAELGDDVLALAYRQRVEVVEPWALIEDAFGVSELDPRLRAESWAAEALIDAAPPGGGWTRPLARRLLRDDALDQLAARRLGLGRGVEPSITTLMRWAMSPGGPALLTGLREVERKGLTNYLSARVGLAGDALFSLVDAGNGADAAAFGLVCAALWQHGEGDLAAQSAVFRARGRAERHFSEAWVKKAGAGETTASLDATALAFGRAAEGYARELLAAVKLSAAAGATPDARRQLDVLLDRADSLVRQFGAEAAAAHSPLLRAGLDARFAAVGAALSAGAAAGMCAAMASLASHELADEPAARHRVARAGMAQRLVEWLAVSADEQEPQTVAAAIDRQISETGWVDLALEHVHSGGDADRDLGAAYDSLYSAVRERRRRIDRAFARSLADWTTAGTDSGSMLTVETFLPRVVAPVVKAASSDDPRLVLLLVLDGMSAAVSAELGMELRQSWAEFDPVTDLDPNADRPRRRAMAAALPTVTEVSRTSLFAAAVMKGDQNDEKRLFPAHRFWGKQSVAVFHKADLRGSDGGDVFGAELTEALYDGRTHVAVVLNEVDEWLDHGNRAGTDVTWGVREMGKLRSLLDLAAAQGRAVIITSDHGHVVDHDHGVKLTADGVLSGRHRAPSIPGTSTDPLQPSEVELAGPRVVSAEGDGRIVALWDADVRYSVRHAGYHGGAALAEFTIPVLAFLPFGAQPPKGWRELADPAPAWWSLSGAPDGPVVAPQPVPAPSRSASKRPAKGAKAPMEGQLGLIDELAAPVASSTQATPATAVSESRVPDPLIAALLASELFQAQCAALGRKPDMTKVEAALHALLDAHGTLPVTALAQRVGVRPTAAAGFAATLQQILNFDSVQVLATLPDGRTLRLDPQVLRTQFEL